MKFFTDLLLTDVKIVKVPFTLALYVMLSINNILIKM